MKESLRFRLRKHLKKSIVMGVMDSLRQRTRKEEPRASSSQATSTEGAVTVSCFLHGFIEIEISAFHPEQLRFLRSVQNLPFRMKCHLVDQLALTRRFVRQKRKCIHNNERHL